MNNITNFTSNFTINIQLETAPAILTAVLITTGLWIIMINLLVFTCLITSRSAKKCYLHLQLMSLCVTDMLVGAFSIPVTLTFKITGSFPTYGACASLFYLYIVSQAATLNHALMICVNRLITVKRKHHINVIKPKLTPVFLQVLLVWTVSFVVISMPFVVYGRFGETLSPCSLNTLFADNYTSAIGIFTGGLLTPHICLNIVYLYMLAFLKQKWKQVHLTNNGLGDMRIAHVELAKSGFQTTQPIDATNSASTGSFHAKTVSRREKDTSASKLSRKLLINNFEKHRLKTATRLVGIKKCALSEGSSLARGAQNGSQFSDRSYATLNERRLDGLSGIDGQRKVLMTIGILLVILNVFMTPLTFLIVFEFLHTGYLSRSVKFIFMNMAILNSALNPIVNVLRVKPFKDALKQKALTLGRLFCK